ncbi:hypothetical protein JL721_9801 [Aureococcus anophagefferens]|nr:hypothetical protein JL721_9801 [Aureococcus anophagefferens]
MAEAFRGLSSSSESEDEDGGFLRTYADERASKRRRMAAAVEAAQESGGGEYDAAAAAAADAAFEGVELPATSARAAGAARLPPRLVLAHHLPGVVERRGDCERELRDLAARRKVKYLQLPTAGSDVAVVDAGEYAAALAGRPAFLEFAMARAGRLYATEAELRESGILAPGEAAAPAAGRRREDERAALDELRAAGLLRPRRDAPGVAACAPVEIREERNLDLGGAVRAIASTICDTSASSR